ncbi:LOW QUALITY PROTEIN: UPF0481 protein At3g47200 [Castanea sativa]|uniref:LOW QUALITY PROTEIN: UPF0481 protein At3g47200 n=1 Tax=Castanea sativa TaxID=21020 RepID=UPI003F64943B
MNLEINEVSKMVLTSAVDIPIVMENNLMCEELIIDIPLVIEPVQWRECCIYKVPKKLRQVNKEAYTPKLISIGPFHHGGKDLRGEKELRDEENENVPMDMEMLKVRYFKDFCYRTGKCQKEIARIIEENEVKIRHCYAEISKLNSEDFVKMVLVDSTFIIELFLRSSQENEKRSQENGPFLKNDARKEDEKDYILSKPWLEYGIKQDLMLLENQLPFFILKELYDQISYSGKNNKISFLFLDLASCGYFSFPKSNIPDGKEVKHLTDLVRYFYCPSIQYNKGSTITHLYSATKLHRAGVMFRNIKRVSRLLDIQFKKLPLLEISPCFNISWFLNCLPCLKCFPCLESMQTLLKVPTLIVDDATEICFQNLMALEQCHYPSESYICNYIMLLDYVINTREDVELFVENKIIINKLGSNELVATMVNDLGLEIVENHSYYGEMAKRLNEHYENYYNHNMGTLTSTYFSNLWRGILTVVGLVVFGHSIWSTIKPFVTHQID